MMSEALITSLQLLAQKKNLPQEMAERLFQIILNGGATPAQIASILTGLAIKGETESEIIAAANVLRAKATKFTAPAGSIDTCGTGGDGHGTYNISTATAIVLASTGVPVAKHGNRSVSSKSGSADVLQALGIKIDAEIPVLEKCMSELGIAFLMAPKFHPSMRHVSPVRQELGVRTIFNILGPICNPAKPDFQLLGVYDKALSEPLARVLKALGTKAAWVVHGHDKLDELTLTGTSYVTELKDGNITNFELTPEDAGLPRATLDELRGGDAETNAKALEQCLSGMESAYKNAVLYNAGAGLVIAGKAANIKEGVNIARDAIDSGKSYRLLKQWAILSNS